MNPTHFNLEIHVDYLTERSLKLRLLADTTVDALIQQLINDLNLSPDESWLLSYQTEILDPDQTLASCLPATDEEIKLLLSQETSQSDSDRNASNFAELNWDDLNDDTEESIPIDAGSMDLQEDDEFVLSESDEGFGDSSDSGSQVIALSDSQAFDEDAATMIADRMFEEDPLDAGMLLSEDDALTPDADMGGLGAEVDQTYAAAGAGFQQEVLPPIQAVEASYSFWNLSGLFIVLTLLILTGVSMTDVARNMWTWQEPYQVSNSVMNLFVGLYEAIRDMVG
jgi:hypothetical protein